MGYKSLRECVEDIDSQGWLKNINGEVDACIDMASIHLKEYKEDGNVLYFQNIKGSEFQAVSNLFGTLNRSKFLFRDSLEIVKSLIELKTNPLSILQSPFKSFYSALHAIYALPKKVIFKSVVPNL